MNDKLTELVHRAQQGSTSAFEELVVLYQDKVFSHCYHLTGNYSDAQDLAQEVFVRAYKGIKSFRNEADFGTWLHRIAINQYLNLRRKEKNNNHLSLDEPLSTDEGEMLRQVAASSDDPVETVEREDLRQLVSTGLERLPPEFKAVLVLREFNDYSYEQMADIMECSLGTVKSRLNRARKALRNEITALARKAGIDLGTYANENE